MKTHIVIPIGVSQPGTPVLSLLEKSIDCILNQTSKEFVLTIASDSNVSDECKELLKKKGVNVKWFEPASFFRKGGIWKKITETWKETDTEYLAFLHYDDVWDVEKLERQIRGMQQENLNSSWSEVYVIDKDDNIVSGDCSHFFEFDKTTIGRRTLGQSHAIIVKRDSFFNSGIMEHEDRWSPVFEDLFLIFCAKMGRSKKVSGAKFFWRNHEMNMSNSILSQEKWKDLMLEQKTVGQYKDDTIQKDVEYMNNVMIETIKKYYNG